ncbi:MAG: hypothetical protein CVV27_00090 [Candidatus Melainabacteria bacterium HGW-Melainabacteria-1]|nr:MAG: hypothetical protein CVV27_00090 [Candidatus Melainabacteria bacterium HGW-Melainabacteria-1]
MLYEVTSAGSTITPANNAPVIQSMVANPASASVVSGGIQSIQLQSEASDQDNDPLTFTWYSNGIQIRSGKSTEYSFGGGTHRLRLDVQDSKGAITSRETTVQINEALPPYTYVLESNSTGNGGGTWGSILTLDAVIGGGRVYFTATKKDGGAFQLDGTVYLKVGTYETFGAEHAKYPVAANNPIISLSDNLNEYKTGWPKQFYVRVENPGGFAWVGPIVINRY